jgi:hypothetical protein
MRATRSAYFSLVEKAWEVKHTDGHVFFIEGSFCALCKERIKTNVT